ncbi:MAG: hypothetical protein M3N98_09365 [Actinomycetota bacterium]|nr:hypothetical protein [Actinomycetota bacterium]
MRRALVLLGCALVLAGCGGGGGTTSGTTLPAATLAITPTTVPQAAIEVRPPSGPVGTSFQLLGTRFQPAEKVGFEIDQPDGKVFTGKTPHTAAADGSVTASYLVTSNNGVGVYQVKATGDKGTHATGQFEVTASASATTGTTVAGHTTTTVSHTTTTKKP